MFINRKTQNANEKISLGILPNKKKAISGNVSIDTFLAKDPLSDRLAKNKRHRRPEPEVTTQELPNN